VTASSLIGFGVVFLLVCGTTSALTTLTLMARRRVLARRGPAVQRRGTELAATIPALLATAVVAILVLESLVGTDHCDTHGDHAHLCLQHGSIWIQRGWAVVALVAGAAVVGARVVVLAIGIVRGRVMVSRLRGTAEVSRGVQLVESERVFCFVAGIVRPTIFVSTAARSALTSDEWDAMLAHERSHVHHRDLSRRLRLELLLLFSAPLAAIVIREQWDVATERLRDADAAETVGSPETVASALVQMARQLTLARVAAGAAFTPHGEHVLTARVESLLDASPRGEPDARRLTRVALVTSTAFVAIAAVFAEPLHHALETLLG